MTSSATFPPILVFDAVSGEYRDPSDSADTTAKVAAPTKTVLVTGASGLLGRQVQLQFARAGWKAIGTGLHRINPPDVVSLNLTSPGAIASLLDSVDPDVVVHCAANRYPDSCTANPAAARAINVEASRALAAATAARNILLIYISTDYVFPGRPGEAPYATTAPPDPPNMYGRTKLEGERAVLAAATQPNRAVVLRVPILYGPCDEPTESAVNVLMAQLWTAQKLSPSDPKLHVDDYALRYPTNTQDVGRVCRDIAAFYLSTENEARELPTVLHFSGDECLTKWGIVKAFAEITGLPVDYLEPVRPQEGEVVGDGTVRPFDCHLDTRELRDLGVDVSTVGFREWWSKELGVFQR
ncbi:Methionine adenosyltransferase 2 subunit beta [Stagonosporopsis vannaccii]|nr:Methionine adenosyltransferase 2 subunit beta [Stagonosporopsis vannaccii]